MKKGPGLDGRAPRTAEVARGYCLVAFADSAAADGWFVEAEGEVVGWLVEAEADADG